MQSFNLNPEHLMQDVYSYPFPEVRKHINGLHLDPSFMLNTIPARDAAKLLTSYAFEPELELTARADGSLDLDELHIPVIDRIRQQVGQYLQGLDTFDHAYPSPGSSQAIFGLLAEWHAKGKFDSLAVIEGEYDGYSAYAASLNIPINKYADFEAAKFQKGQVWFVSNPNAVDGNWIDQEKWQAFLDQGHEVVIDTAYAGLTPAGQIDVTNPNIRAVLTSPSKIFGVFRYRNTGVTYAREAVDAMYGNKWFKDVPALLDTLSLYEKFGSRELPGKYRSIQEFLCRRLTELVDADVNPSDVLLLANSQGPVGANYEEFSRAGNYRFGLTKLFEDYELAASRDT